MFSLFSLVALILQVNYNVFFFFCCFIFFCVCVSFQGLHENKLITFNNKTKVMIALNGPDLSSFHLFKNTDFFIYFFYFFF